MILLDSNVLIYAMAAEAPWHASAIQALHGLRASNDEVWVSCQVLRECLAAFTRPQPFSAAVPETVAAEWVRDFRDAYQVADETLEVNERLLQLVESIRIGGAQVHDANIVATMQVHGIPRLLTGNVRDFDRFAHLIEVVPLA